MIILAKYTFTFEHDIAQKIFNKCLGTVQCSRHRKCLARTVEITHGEGVGIEQKNLVGLSTFVKHRKGVYRLNI